MAQDRLYFSYGERTPDLMGEIIGRIPESQPAILLGFQLCTQRCVDLPGVVRNILSANRTEREAAELETYGVVAFHGASTPGLINRVSDQEVALLNNYDIDGLWFTLYEDCQVNITDAESPDVVVDAAVHAEPFGRHTIFSDAFEGPFPPALSDPVRAGEIARLSREEFLAS